MVTNSIAAGVYDDDDHNSTEHNIIDLFEPAGKWHINVHTLAII